MKAAALLLAALVATACGGNPTSQEPNPLEKLSGMWTATIETKIAVGEPTPPVSYVARLEVRHGFTSKGQIALMSGLCEPKPPSVVSPSWSQPPDFTFTEPVFSPYWSAVQPVRCVQTAFAGCEHIILYLNDMYVEEVSDSEFSITGSGSAVGCNVAKRTLFTLRGVKATNSY